jgi:kojibiose phosphorylase
VDDSAYTNAMARLNLELGRAADAWLGRMYPQRRATLRRRLALDARELERWDDVAARLAVDLNPAGRPIEEFAGYFELEDLTPGELAPPGTALQDALGLARLAQTQVIKQADVVLLCHLLGEYLRPATVAASFDYYAPRCAHASSLSPSIYALIAARLGREGEARRLFQRAATLDLNRATRRGGAGVHAANCGGLWQATVFGVAGMRLLADGLAFAPHLLPGWDSLAFAVRWHGARLSVQIEREPAIARFQLGEPGEPSEPGTEAKLLHVRLPGQAPRRLHTGEATVLPLSAKPADERRNGGRTMPGRQNGKS